MSVYEALFLIDRGGTNHHVTGARAHYDVQPLDTVLVQRGDVTYRSTYKKPSLPEFTRRFTYTREYDAGEGKYLHPKGDGVINFGHDFGTAGNFPAEEWVNVRNRDAVFNDLDGKLFDIKESTVAKEWDTVHITEEGGDFEAWYIVDRTDGWLRFKIQNVVNGRNNVNVGEVKGTPPGVDDGAILQMDFYRADNIGWSNIEDDDLVVVWEDDKTKHIKGDLFKDLFPIAPAGSVSVAYTYDKALLEDSDSRKALFDGVSKFFWIEADGSWRVDVTKTGSVEIMYAELSQHEGIAYWGEDPDEFKFLYTQSVYTDVHFLPWCNTTNWVTSHDFCRSVSLGYEHDFDADGVYHSITGLQYIDTKNWTSLQRLFYNTPMQNVDWTGAATWNTSKVTSFSKVFRYGGTSAQCPVDLAAAWDFTKSQSSSIFYCPRYGVPRWAERIEWGPAMPSNALMSAGGGCHHDPDKDLCEDGLGPLDLRGWCVTNQTTRPNDFFVSAFNVNDSTFNDLVYPLWGTCAEKIEEFTFPTNKVILDMRIHGDKSATVNKDRNIDYEGLDDVYPVIDVHGQAYVLPKLTGLSSPFKAPLDDCPDGYIFVGNPSTFEFGSKTLTQSANKFTLEVSFTEYCNTSLWAHTDDSKAVFAAFTKAKGGFEYIDTSKFTTLNSLFYNAPATKIKNDHYETPWPWAGCANWDTSKVKSMKYVMKRSSPDMPKMNWDFTAVEDASLMFSTNYGTPKWVEDIQWGPNLTNLESFGSGFGSYYPSGGSSLDNYYIGQERPLDLSKWDVRNISSTPAGFMSTSPFESYGLIATWTVEPNWGTTGS